MSSSKLEGEAASSTPPQQKPSLLELLPAAFLSFLKANEIDAAEYCDADNLPRYIRVNARRPVDAEALRREFGASLRAVAWLPGFFSLEHDVQLAASPSYKEGRVYGMDVASGVAVAVLNPQKKDHVLDLCCAPGAKLCYLHDWMGLEGGLKAPRREGEGSVTGVDCSEQRLAACRSVIKKYDVRARLALADGTSFDTAPLESCDAPEAEAVTTTTKGRKRKRHNRGSQHPSVLAAAVDEAEASSALSERGISRLLYDKVLVDAECTHDGSIKHLEKYTQWGWDTLESRLLDPERVRTITTLQLALLRNGYRLLAPGHGEIVYSTCSLSRHQNEALVEKFLEAEPTAELLPANGSCSSMPCRQGIGEGIVPERTLRFDPTTSRTSGLFIALFRKRARPT